jgi:hypothetical protein
MFVGFGGAGFEFLELFGRDSGGLQRSQRLGGFGVLCFFGFWLSFSHGKRRPFKFSQDAGKLDDCGLTGNCDMPAGGEENSGRR